MSTTTGPSSGVLRGRADPHQVGAIELFFDLVYVFTIIQLSHFLLEHLTWTGAAQAGVLFLAVWWGWNYTAWAMNWLDPEHATVRGLLAVLMLAALAMAVAVPHAFTEHAWLFVAGYLFLQVVRSAFMVLAFRGGTMGRNYAQLLVWVVVGGLLWVSGLLVEDELRLLVWAVAVTFDYLAPYAGFWVPGRGRTPMSSWPLDEAHLAERNRLVFIIALGESILILGGTLADVEWRPAVLTAAVIGFATVALLWWLYFSYRLGNAEHELPAGVDATTMARAAFAYAHALMVAGVIVVAVGIEEVTLHPDDAATGAVAATIVGGPALYLLGNVVYNRARSGIVPRSRLVALASLVVLLPFAVLVPAVVLSAGVVLVLFVLAAATGELRASPSR